jgi:hypothetical protein
LSFSDLSRDSDWNGDGKTDAARVVTDGIKFVVSTGTGWDTYPGMTCFGQKIYSDTRIFPVFTGDWNGDGRTDISRCGVNALLFVTATDGGWKYYGSADGLGAGNGNLARDQGYSNGHKYPILTGDWNGDGFTDIA